MTMQQSRPAVVVVDDDEAVANSLKFSLELDGFDVSTYPGGTALLAAEALPRCGCLVLDVKMPGMSGLELLGRLRERRVELPAVLITGSPSARLRDRAAAAGCPVVEKPLLDDALVEAVRQSIGISGV